MAHYVFMKRAFQPESQHLGWQVTADWPGLAYGLSYLCPVWACPWEWVTQVSITCALCGCVEAHWRVQNRLAWQFTSFLWYKEIQQPTSQLLFLHAGS